MYTALWKCVLVPIWYSEVRKVIDQQSSPLFAKGCKFGQVVCNIVELFPLEYFSYNSLHYRLYCII